MTNPFRIARAAITAKRAASKAKEADKLFDRGSEIVNKAQGNRAVGAVAPRKSPRTKSKQTAPSQRLQALDARVRTSNKRASAQAARKRKVIN